MRNPNGTFKKVRPIWNIRRWNDGYIDNKGRFRVFRPDYPRAFKSGYALRAHVVFWLWNGRVHPRGTDLHHDNENRLDDRIKNLIQIDHGKHTILHCAKPPAIRICKNCGMSFEIPKWRLRDASRGTFCSQRCYQQAPRSSESKRRISISLQRAYRTGIR